MFDVCVIEVLLLSHLQTDILFFDSNKEMQQKNKKEKKNDENGVFPLFSFHSGTTGKKKLRSSSTMDGIGGYFDKIVNKNAALVVGILA